MGKFQKYYLGGKRIAILQQVLPHYRLPFFTKLVEDYGINLTVYADMQPSGSLGSVHAESSFKIIHAPLTKFGPFIFQSAILDVLKDKAFDAVVLSWNARYLLLPIALFTAKARGMPVALWGHGYSKKESFFRGRYRNWLLQLADAGITYNKETTESLVSIGILRGRLFTAGNAIDQAPIRAAIGRWQGQTGELDAFRKQHHLDPEKTAIFVSRIEKDKGLPLLLEAFGYVVNKIPDSRLVIVGEGTELPVIRKKITVLGLDEQVTCTGAIYEEGELAPWMLSSTCLVCPRAVGLSILHGFGYGLPCITSDDLKCHGPEITALNNEVNGLYYRDGDAQSLADCILSSFENKKIRERFRLAAQSTVSDEGEYSLQSMAQGYAQALKAICR